MCGWQLANSAGREAWKLWTQGAPFYVQLDGVGPATYTTLTRPRFRVVPPQRIFSPSEVAIDILYIRRARLWGQGSSPNFRRHHLAQAGSG